MEYKVEKVDIQSDYYFELFTFSLENFKCVCVCVCVCMYVCVYIYIYIYIYIYVCVCVYVLFTLQETWGSIPGRIIPKTLKMVLNTSLLNTQQYKVHIKDKVEQSGARSSTLPLNLNVVAIEKGAFWLPSTMVANFTLLTYLFIM